MFISGEKEKENVAEERLRQLQTETSKAESERMTKQSHFELINGVPAESLPEVLDDATLADYQSKLATPVTIFEALCCSPPALTDERRTVCVRLAPELEHVLERWDRSPNGSRPHTG